MRFKKIVSGLLACALVATSVFTGNVTTAKAETAGATEPAVKTVSDDDPVPVSTYGFQVTGDNGQATSGLGEGVTLKYSPGANAAEDLADYTKAAKFVAGRSGKTGDYAVDTEGNHGIILPDKQLGENYTVSLWVKPTDLGSDGWAKSILFVGKAKPSEKWVSVAMGSGTGNVTCWSPGTPGWGNTHMTIEQDKWQMITVVQSGTNAKFYLDGVKKYELVGDAHKGMEDAEQFISLGTNHWDGNFHGVYDDVSVYNQALTDAQIAKLYGTDESNFSRGEPTVSMSSKLIAKGAPRAVALTLPGGVSKDKVNVSYTSSNTAVATVEAATGMVTPLTVGLTTITATVTLKDSTVAAKTATVDIEVEAGKGNALAVDYDFANSTGKTLTDISGNGHNATIHGAEASFENGALVLHGGTKNTADPDYVDLPLSIIDDLDDPEQFTIEVEFAKTANVLNAWLFCLGSNPKDKGTNYMFLSPNFKLDPNGSLHTLRAGISNTAGQSAGGEKLFDTTIEPPINKSYTVYMVFDSGNITLYWNGIKIRATDGKEILESGYSIMDDVITPGCKNNILGYIGKSCWKPDDYYQGTVSKFKIHNKAMTDEEVAETFSGTFSQMFQSDLDANIKTIIGTKNESKDKVIYNLPLMATYEETPITWISNKPEIITADGTVNNPATATEVELTAKVTSGALTGTAKITLTVLPADKSKLAEAIADAKEAVKNPFRGDSKKELEALIAKESKVMSQTDVDKLISDIKKAIAKKDYSPLYMNPFTEIPDDFNPAVSEMITLKPAETKTVKAKDIPDKVKDAVNVTYESMATDIAAVDENGMVTAQNKVGYAMIVTKVSAKYDDFTLEYYTLVKVDVDLSGVKATPKASSLAKGNTTTITVTVPSDIKGSTKSYRATGAVSVDKNGKVTAKSAGTGKVYVKVSVGGKSITKTVTVKVGEITGASTLKVKKSTTLKVSGLTGKVTWSLDKKGKKLAKITKKGKLTAKKKAGKVKVTAKVGKVSMTKTITIKKK